ncbi:hypothetical protein ISF_00603 [Cordyceps fumosorosea ARSEF 2679]|uniref:Uncharacterized protein n=1 Tax=Cordyceps fumosorosea (strain ARSEF 2679) TaxID=1081104 RepID=A0A162JTU0_CORFA|nr:hypothetical protein ISF_00603 [Cordyceps fumosorosea ARSEF 2679]OAA73702.1 hypothetical protein ISF_00603 [Cordyceps fumosorosea ARSEF 2679]
MRAATALGATMTAEEECRCVFGGGGRSVVRKLRAIWNAAMVMLGLARIVVLVRIALVLRDIKAARGPPGASGADPAVGGGVRGCG